MTARARYGSTGERALQQRYGTEARASAFYREQMMDELNGAMRAFIDRMEMAFVSTADVKGNCDCSFRAGPPGFVRVLDAHTLVYPEYRGNGVMASLGNITENGRVGLLFVDFFQSGVGLHVNGRAKIVDSKELSVLSHDSEALAAIESAEAPQPERWVLVEVEEAYIHCAKHVPRLMNRDKSVTWGTDDARLKGGDYFGVSARHRNGSAS